MSPGMSNSRASPTRFFWPAESVHSGSSIQAAMPTRSIAATAVMPGRLPYRPARNARFSRALNDSFMPPRWPSHSTWPLRLSRDAGLPSKRISPSPPGSMPASTRRRVVLPEPLSPSTSTVSPRPRLKSSGPNTGSSLRENASRCADSSGAAGAGGVSMGAAAHCPSAAVDCPRRGPSDQLVQFSRLRTRAADHAKLPEAPCHGVQLRVGDAGYEQAGFAPVAGTHADATEMGVAIAFQFVAQAALPNLVAGERQAYTGRIPRGDVTPGIVGMTQQ